ncbi:MAG: tetratricopeptide repeat protein [Planctomycetes bacterium]|nr:tetratricopeptide repeat protein [Planctomycetota bacterium]
MLSRAIERVQTHPGDGEAWGELAMLCQAHGLYEEALYAYRQAEERQPHDPRWPHLRGIVCQFLSLPDVAAGAFSRALELDEKDLVSLCSLARIHQERGEDDEARKLYVRVVALDPNHVAARVGLGQLGLRAGALPMAKRNLELALEVEPRCGPAHATLAQIYALEGNETRAGFHRRWSQPASGKIPLPDPLMDQALELGVSSTAWMNRGKLAGRRGEWKRAVKDFQQAVKLRGDLTEPRYFLGVALLEAGETEEALRELRAVTTLEGRKVDAWLQIARAHRERGDLGGARRPVAEALKVDPESPEALFLEGKLFLEENQPELALGAFDRAIALHPNHAPSYAGRAEVLLPRKEDQEAVKQNPELLKRERERAQAALEGFERALELQADLADAYEGAGVARMQLWELTQNAEEKAQHLEKAIERFTQLVKYFPENKSGHVRLIWALHAAGRADESIAAIHRAAQRWPDDPRFRRIRRE